MNATLVILAAGLGSRYGSAKQIDVFGPNGECIMDYGLYDAIDAGFTKVILIVRQEMKDEIEQLFFPRWKNKIEIEIVVQAMDYPGYLFAEKTTRTKPWGTAHALLCAKNYIQTPFAVINADDFYGRDAYHKMKQFFESDNGSGKFAMIGYLLENTLSENGGVSRGICRADQNNLLRHITERKNIATDHEDQIVANDNLMPRYLSATDIVSMNFWGFWPEIFVHIEKLFAHFIHTHLKHDEFYIPFVAQQIIDTTPHKIIVLPTDAHWFGVTHANDKKHVSHSLSQLINNQVYPSPLWNTMS